MINDRSSASGSQSSKKSSLDSDKQNFDPVKDNPKMKDPSRSPNKSSGESYPAGNTSR